MLRGVANRILGGSAITGTTITATTQFNVGASDCVIAKLGTNTPGLPAVGGAAQFWALQNAAGNSNATLRATGGGGDSTLTITAGSSIFTMTNAGPATLAGGAFTTNSGTAIPAGGANTLGLKATSTANFGVFFGSGAPTLSTAKGSLYLRSDGTGVADRAYINTDGGTTWTAIATAA